MTPIKNKPVDYVPEVEAFEKVKLELEDFKANNPEFFEELQDLLERYNATRDLAEKAVRAKQISCGPFQLTGRPSVIYDAQGLYEEMGRDWFLQNGGSTKLVTEYSIDKAKVEAAFSVGLLPGEVAEKVRKIKIAYHKPEKAELP